MSLGRKIAFYIKCMLIPKGGTAVASVINVETEMDYVVHSVKITKKRANIY